ncbi:PREDICTED: ubiquitin carboxyl-terminal hydrolase 32 isoform X2 [Nicrophorus vespilloides]|uniref:ubiquitinyl hydrolase 1 n=1 Tax=Nicrophorus vespilloides TaxID=110193 RepID=A0ABM1NEA4_NICVS|nr:PREDICTED: ubiquitin carboxyl-terminal hydrolase 32 isoform X2 [Nicrophorus vespilloides]
MGAKDSKRTCLSYEDAVKRMSDVEFKRVCEAFKRLTGGGQLLSRHAFTQNVLGDGVPVTIAESLYIACGGGPRGIALRDLICGLVLLTKGTEDEKIRFLWTLYSNDSGTYISRTDFQSALQIEGSLPPNGSSGKSNLSSWDTTLISLFGVGQDRVAFDHFRARILYNKEATILSKWLLSTSCVSLSSELETPTFYQSLAGVTHLEEYDICELEKCFWSMQSSSHSGQLDAVCVSSLISPPVPSSACPGLFLALDVNRDGHIDFKELCCGISAACRGPTAERMKFCFKIFDMDRDNNLNPEEFQHMVEILAFVMEENREVLRYERGGTLERRKRKQSVASVTSRKEFIDDLKNRRNAQGNLSQEDFLVWCVENNELIAPLLELLYQVCHVALGLRPDCRHHEYEIVMGWLDREEHRGYMVGQFWYLISSDWWKSWLNYTTSQRTCYDQCNCKRNPTVLSAAIPLLEEGIVCDESFTSNSTDYTSNEFTSNSTDSMGDLLSRADNCSIASSSGVSSSCSGTSSGNKRGMPGPIDNSSLVEMPEIINNKVATLTGEGGRLKRDTPLVQDRDFVLIPDSLWKALALWYGGPLPLPRQVIKPPGSNEVELELYPLNLKILRHQNQQGVGSGGQNNWGTIVGGYGAAALSTAGLSPASSAVAAAAPRRYLTHTAAFSRLANVRQVVDFLAVRLSLRVEDIRLWLVKETSILLEDELSTLQELGIVDCDQILLEVRNKDLTWPEELGALASGANNLALQVTGERRPTITLPPGATGLHNLGNTCFMNAALQAVSNTRPLTQYFQRNGQLCELNSSNPLGTKGQVARRYAELCRELWAGSTRSVAPLKLRWCVTKHAPHLGGGGQHDSQELLAWLLDALHEDLNRVAKKQYTELRDSDGRPDTIVADEAWLQHLARDHSIITDLFYGQLKSKVKCEVCGHESVRFDAFNLLSLPLPMESFILCEVLVVKLSGETPIKYGTRLNSEARYSELKAELEILCGVPAERILLAEVAYSQIRNVLLDESKISVSTATELYAYELPRAHEIHRPTIEVLEENEVEVLSGQSPLARSPENATRANSIDITTAARRLSNGIHYKRSLVPQHSNVYTDTPAKSPTYLMAVHRKCVQQETYFLSQHKSKPSIFGVPLLLGCNPATTCKGLYEAVWDQVNRLLSPMPQSDQTNHATDCDDSLGYEFPFTLKAVLKGGQICALCHWTQFCRGCRVPLSEEILFDACKAGRSVMCIAIDWDQTALHLRYQSTREKVWIEHESVGICRKLHTEPIDLDYCLKAFTSEERLEAKYHCSNCKERQPATKKLQIWRLPPILIVHLKRFDFCNNKWVKTQKAVNFPFKNFDPTSYLASVPQETIIRHIQIKEERKDNSCEIVDEEKLVDFEGTEKKREKPLVKRRERLESTSLTKTPIVDENLQDFHQHKLIDGQDPFDLKYQLYAVVSHSGMLNGGHYISYACNPNGSWYCYNDSSCRECVSQNCESKHVKQQQQHVDDNNKYCSYSNARTPKIDTSSAYILFYERSGLDYRPYLPPEVVANGGNVAYLQEDELEENESEMRKQLCNLQ